MDYDYINNLKARREKILNSEKELFSRKEIGSWDESIKASKKRIITISIKLPTQTDNSSHYIPNSFIEKYYDKEPANEYVSVWYSLKKDKSEEASKIRIPLDIEQPLYSKKDVLNFLNRKIKFYQKVVKSSCKVIERNIRDLQEKLEQYKNYLK